MGLRGFFVLAAKIWSFVCYCFRRQVRAVSVSTFFRFYPLKTSVRPYCSKVSEDILMGEHVLASMLTQFHQLTNIVQQACVDIV